MTTVAVPQLAAYEPALHPAVEEHEEGSHLVLWAVCFFRETENLSQAWGGGGGGVSLAVCLKGCGLCMQVSDEKPCFVIFILHGISPR